ncbi:MAG: Nitrous oxide-stimulated promoter [Oscillospiraceae bacterium]|nr:Nitrous oxide-stimulated promoter [Oscillospiraceae bacterium]
MNTDQRRRREQLLIAKMIRLYCRNHHGQKDTLCPQCHALTAYAEKKTNACPLMETKSFCSACTVHCYRPDMREVIRVVMRWAGPRMLFYHPVLAIRHVLATRRTRGK